ncbi:hypothetical protein E2320_016412 [Naja naja]|nr:hypothetical protein E2320_016412 [Naja naja]
MDCIVLALYGIELLILLPSFPSLPFPSLPSFPPFLPSLPFHYTSSFHSFCDRPDIKASSCSAAKGQKTSVIQNVCFFQHGKLRSSL